MKNDLYLKKGYTIIEVMFALVIIAILVVGSGSFLYYGSSRVAVERNKSLALATANSCLEEFKGSGFDSIKPANDDYSTYFLRRRSSSWEVLSTDPEENLSINGIQMPVQFKVRYIDGNGGAPSYDFLEVSVNIRYGGNSKDFIKLDTYIGPDV
ncbi:MAG: type II secretion system protein [Candidatus Omnitrophota bacterium]